MRITHIFLEKSMHGRRYASKYTLQGVAVAQVRAEAQLIVLMLCCDSKWTIPVLNRTAENSVHISTAGEGSRVGRVFLAFVA